MSGSIAPVALFHDLSHTATGVLVLLFPGAAFTVLTGAMRWAVVERVEERHPVDR